MWEVGNAGWKYLGARTATCSCLLRTGLAAACRRTIRPLRPPLVSLPVLPGVRRGRVFLQCPHSPSRKLRNTGPSELARGGLVPSSEQQYGYPLDLRTQSALQLGIGRVDKDSVGMGQEDHHHCLDGLATVLRAQILRPQTPLCIESD